VALSDYPAANAKRVTSNLSLIIFIPISCKDRGEPARQTEEKGTEFPSANFVRGVSNWYIPKSNKRTQSHDPIATIARTAAYAQ